MSTRTTKSQLAAELAATRTELEEARAELAQLRAELRARTQPDANRESDVTALLERVRGRVRTLERWGTALIPPRPDSIVVVARTAESELERLAEAIRARPVS